MVQQSQTWAYIQRNKHTSKRYMHFSAQSSSIQWTRHGEPKCPSIDEWIKKMWCTYAMEYYTAIKKNEIVPFAATWMDLEIIILSGVSQTKKEYISYSTYIWNLKKKMNLLIKQN